MEPVTRRMLKIVVGIMAALLFAVAILSYFTFSENNYVADYAKIRDIVAANPRMSGVSTEKSSERFSFSMRERSSSPASSEDSVSDSAEAEEGGEPSSSSVSSGSSSSSSRSSPSSSSSSSLSGSSRDAYSSSSEPQSSSDSDAGEKIAILGASVLTKAQLLAYSAPYIANMRLTCSCEELIGYYLSIGAKYGVRGDIAYLQAILETGWFKFNRPDSYLRYDQDAGKWIRVYEPRPEGLYVKPEDNNFCGLGVTGRLGDEKSLCRFDTAALGVEAHVQHLYAYACKSALPAGTTRIDPRFGLVTRGCAPYWNDLGGGKWAADTEYSAKILNSYNKALNNC